MNLNILHEDKHIIVVEKPPKVPSQGDPSGDKDMITLIKEHLVEKNPQNKDPYVAVVHRLDRPVGGIMVYAKTKLAAGDLNKQIQNKELNKTYYCVTSGVPDNNQGSLVNWLKRIKSKNMSKVVLEKSSGCKEAILDYNVLDTTSTEEDGNIALIKVNLITGRHHQIRVQFEAINNPLWGDTKYNDNFGRGSGRGWTQIALFAGGLSFKHPKTKQVLSYELDIPKVEPFNKFNYIG